MNTEASALTAPTDIPALTPRAANRQVRLINRPTAIPQASDFAIVEDAIPEPAAGQFLVRNIYLSVDPAQRGWAQAEANYSQPVPLGSPMRALAVAVVLESRCDGVVAGEYLYGWFGWQEFSVADPGAIILRARLGLPLAQFAGLAGINGLTAYLALTGLGHPKAGDTLLVSTAAGGVGSLVGQIGKVFGCRTIGLTGDDRKVELCRTRYGYDHAYNYRSTDLAAALTQAAPEGLDIFYDNTGGAILDTALRHMRIGGRVVQCGTAANATWTPPPQGLRNEREVMTRRLVWSGFVIFDHLAELETVAAELGNLYAQGRIDLALEVLDGIGHAPQSIADLYEGRNMGKRLICIA